jgi:hypothetical protein
MSNSSSISKSNESFEKNESAIHSEKTNIEEYLPFKYDDFYNINDILKNTKKLIQNSGEYNNFVHKFTEKVQIISFKLPEVTTYPISKNKELIPISKNNYDIAYELEGKGNVRKEIQSASHTKSRFPRIDISKKNLIKIELPKKRGSLFSSSSSEDIKNLVSPREEVQKSKFAFSSRNTTNKILSNSLPIVNGSPRNITFSEIPSELEFLIDHQNNLKLTYNPSNIFNRIEFYLQLMQEKIEYFKNIKNENLSCNLTKKIHQNSPKEILMTLNSVRIELRNLTDKSKLPIHFYFPLAFLPIFYYNDIEVFKIFLVNIVKFNDRFDSVSIDEQSIYDLLNTMREFQNYDCDDYFNEDPFQNSRNYFFKKNNYNIYDFYWVTPKYAFEVSIRY